MHVMDAHPATGSPKINFLTTIKITATNAIKQNSRPINDANTSGVVENATIPSILYLNNDQKFHFVCPATRSTFS